MVPQYNDVNDPVYFDIHGKLTPHFQLSMEENLKGWGSDFDALTCDTSRMPAHVREYLASLPPQTFRDALRTGAFGTMASAWKAAQAGTFEANKKKKNSNARRGQRKAAVSN